MSYRHIQKLVARPLVLWFENGFHHCKEHRIYFQKMYKHENGRLTHYDSFHGGGSHFILPVVCCSVLLLSQSDHSRWWGVRYGKLTQSQCLSLSHPSSLYPWRWNVSTFVVWFKKKKKVIYTKKHPNQWILETWYFKEWTDLNFANSQRAAEDQEKW